MASESHSTGRGGVASGSVLSATANLLESLGVLCGEGGVLGEEIVVELSVSET